MILAAAIKFHIDKTDENVVLCGCRHSDIFKQLKSLGFDPKKGYKEIEQGFITNKNKFLTREEAYVHAITCGQVRLYREDMKRLMSEDLW